MLARARPRGHLLLADELLAAWTTSAARPDPPCWLSLFPGFSLALSLSRPKTTVAAVRHSSRHRPPLAPPTSSGAPPRLPLPPHRSTAPRKPCITATSPFPSSGSDHRRRRIRRLQRVPEPASTPTATAVSYATVSPSSSPRSKPLLFYSLFVLRQVTSAVGLYDCMTCMLGRETRTFVCMLCMAR